MAVFLALLYVSLISVAGKPQLPLDASRNKRVHIESFGTTAVEKLGRAVSDPLRWKLLATVEERLSQLTELEACTFSDSEAQCAKNGRIGMVSPRSATGMRLHRWCVINQHGTTQQGTAQPKVKDGEPTLFQRFDDTFVPALRRNLGLTALSTENAGMLGVLRRLAVNGIYHVAFIGDSAMEHVFVSLMCDAQRSATTPELSKALAPTKIRAMGQFARGFVVGGLKGSNSSVTFERARVNSVPITIKSSNGTTAEINMAVSFIKLQKNERGYLRNSQDVGKFLLEFAPRGLVVVNFGSNLHAVTAVTDFTVLTTRPWLRALEQYIDGGGIGMWMETAAQHFHTRSGLFEALTKRLTAREEISCPALKHDEIRHAGDFKIAEMLVSHPGTSTTRNLLEVWNKVGGDFKNQLTKAVLPLNSQVRFLPWYNITATRHGLHPGQGDCAHFAYTPFLYEPLNAALHFHLDDLLTLPLDTF